jgi:hypothetical protein
MGKLLDQIGSSEAAFIARQNVFFVATAPLSDSHHVNLSPKAPGSSLVVLDPHTVGYIDLTGSGAETAAHVLENGRMTLLFCNLEEGPPKILRLYGTAQLIVKEDVDPILLAKFPEAFTKNPGFRCIFLLTVNRITSSCGYSLPIMTYQRTRSTLDEYAERRGSEGMKDYCLYNNSFSIDGLPSVAQLRNPNVTIGAKPEDGYVRGEVIAKEKPLTKFVRHSTSSRQTKPSSNSTMKLFLFGVMVFVAGNIFALEILPRCLFLVEVPNTTSRIGKEAWTGKFMNATPSTEL